MVEWCGDGVGGFGGSVERLPNSILDEVVPVWLGWLVCRLGVVVGCVVGLEVGWFWRGWLRWMNAGLHNVILG